MDVVECIRAADTTKESLKKMASELNKNRQTIVRKFDEIICQLDILRHSAGILILLAIKSESATTSNAKDKERFFTQIQEFINDCDGMQVCLFPQQFSAICSYISKALLFSSEFMKGIAIFRKAIPKVQTISSQLTTVHADLCKFCLLAKCLKPAFEFLDVDITDISEAVDVRSFMSYYYYGASIYLGYQHYKRALYFLKTILETPGAVVSQIQLEALKKYILVSLILKTEIELSQHLESYSRKAANAECTPYFTLAIEYDKATVEGIEKLRKTYESQFSKDGNIGLLKQVISAKIKSNIQNLTLTFITLSLEDVKTKCKFASVEETEKKILEMVEDGEIFAKIDHRAGMVSFLDDPEKYDSMEMYRKIQEEVEKCKSLGKQVAALNADLVVNNKFLEKLKRHYE